MKTIVIGLGNPILGDDAIGCRIAEEIARRLKVSQRDDIEVEQFYRGGIALMERLIGYDQALILDSIQGLGGEPGTVHRFSVEDLPSLYADSSHDTTFKAALEMGRSLKAPLPAVIMIIAVEIKSSFEFSENLSPSVEKSIPEAVDIALQFLVPHQLSLDS